MSEAGATPTTLDALLRGRLLLAQPARGARVGMDPLLLAAFAAGLPGRAPARVLDLGTGTGVLALAALLRWPRARAVGVDVQPGFVALAGDNAARNQVAERFAAVAADYRAKLPAAAAAAQAFELIVSNPPYFAEGRGRISPAADRAAARAETAATLGDLARAAARHLAPRGRLAVILPAGRLAEWLAALATARLTPSVVRAVHSVADEPARRVLVAAGRGHAGALELLPPLVVHGADRKAYTAEAQAILDGAWLPDAAR